MPKSRQKGEYWHTCIKCGREYPESDMIETRKGWVYRKFYDPEDDN